MLLPAPVPIYLTYLTAQVNGDQISFIDDVYGRDRRLPRCAKSADLHWPVLNSMKLRPKSRPSS